MNMFTRLLYPTVILPLLFLMACREEEPQNQAPVISLIQPVDTFGQNEDIPVELLFTDDSGLELVQITLGTQTGGNQGYHFSERGLSGTNDELSFNVSIPPNFDAVGENYILVKCRDQDGAESILDQSFHIVFKDNQAPSLDGYGAFGFLSSDPAIVFEINYTVSDNEALDRIEARLKDFNNGGAIFATETAVLSGKTAQGSLVFYGGSRFQVGQSFSLELVVFDKAGNQTSFTFPSAIGVVS